jgi:hypothetical protein
MPGIAVFPPISRIKEQMRVDGLQLLRLAKAKPPIFRNQTRRAIWRLEE